jgi:succinate-acetate transporter protein
MAQHDQVDARNSSEKFMKMGTQQENGNHLSRQLTVQLSPDQYERLFFQPSAAKGDLTKRLGNPTLLGVLGFLIPFTVTVFCLLEFKGASTSSFPSISGSWYFFGGIALIVAGIFEFILGNTFPFVLFIVYGVHWLASAYGTDPWHPLTAAYGPAPANELVRAYTSGQGHYNIVMAMVSALFAIGALRTNLPLFIAIFFLIFVFSFSAAGQFQLGYNPTPEGIEYAVKLFKIAGGFGFITVISSWYLCIILMCASTDIPCPLPNFDLSQKIFVHNKAQENEHVGVVREGAVA